MSSSGIEPAGLIFPRSFPQLYERWFRHRYGEDDGDMKALWVEIDVLCEIAAIAGIMLSGIAAR